MANLNGKLLFTDREIQVIQLLFEELTTNEIGDRINLSPRTIQGYRGRILEKTGAKNCVGIIKYGIKKGILRVD